MGFCPGGSGPGGGGCVPGGYTNGGALGFAKSVTTIVELGSAALNFLTWARAAESGMVPS